MAWSSHRKRLIHDSILKEKVCPCPHSGKTIPASAVLLPDAVTDRTDHFSVLAELRVGQGRTRSVKGLEVVTKRNLGGIDPAAFRVELGELGINDWPTPPPGVSVDQLLEDFYSVLNPIILQSQA